MTHARGEVRKVGSTLQFPPPRHKVMHFLLLGKRGSFLQPNAAQHHEVCYPRVCFLAPHSSRALSHLRSTSTFFIQRGVLFFVLDAASVHDTLLTLNDAASTYPPLCQAYKERLICHVSFELTISSLLPSILSLSNTICPLLQ